MRSSLRASIKVRTGILLGVTALGFWALVLLPRSPQAPPVMKVAPEILECRLQAGDELAFRLHDVTDSVAVAATQHRELGAVLHWRVLARQGAGWLVAAALDELTLDQSPPPATPLTLTLRAAWSEPFLIELGRDCRFKRMGFAGISSPPGSEALVRSQLEALIRSMEIVLPVVPVRQWTARQEDPVGSYEGHYQLETPRSEQGGAVISRRRIRYFAFHLPAPGPKLAGPNAEIVSSQARATLDLSGRWLAALSSQDHVKVSLGERPLVDVRGSLELARIDSSPPLARLVGLATERFVFRSALQAEEGPPQPKVPDESLAALDLEGALADFQRRLGSGKGGLHDAVATLAGYLTQRPGAIAELMGALRDGSIEPKLHASLLLALERTGTPQAERALAQGVGDRRLSSVDRMRAAVALADVPHPSGQAVDALVMQARARGGDAEAQDVSRSALLALGTLDRNTATSNPELAAKVREALGARLRAGPPSDELMTDLDAVGNSGDESLLPAIERYADDPSPLVRAHAAGAYRRAQGSADEARLTAWLRREPDPRVRREIVASLAERVEVAGGDLSSDLLATVISWLPQEQDAQVRGLLIRLLGEIAARIAEAKQALVEQFHRERQPELLELIGHYCSVDELG